MSEKDMQVSPTCSSFEVLDPHDPVISRLATQLFKVTKDYFQEEMSAGQEHYQLLEEVNRVTCSKFGDLRSAITNLHTSFKTYDEGYIAQIKPLLDSIDALDEEISAFEANAYRLDAYTRELKRHYKHLEERRANTSVYTCRRIQQQNQMQSVDASADDVWRRHQTMERRAARGEYCSSSIPNHVDARLVTRASVS